MQPTGDDLAHRTPSFPAVRDALLDRFGSPPATVFVEESGTSAAGRWLCIWPDGRRFFVKAGLSGEHDHGIRTEALVYEHVLGSFLARRIVTLEGDDASPPVLVLEDLSTERWGGDADIRWEARQIQMAVEEMEALPPPDGLRPLEPDPAWEALAADVPALCGLGPAEASWWEAALPTLAEAEASVEVAGAALVRAELGPEHWSWKQEAPVVVDWASAAIGDARATRALVEAEIRARKGPSGWLLAQDEGAWAAWAAGQLARRATEGDDLARPAAQAALKWSATALDLPVPPGP